MKKKILSVILATAMVFSLAACGGSDNANNAPAEGDAQQEEPADDAEAPADDAEAEEPADDAAATDIVLDGSWPEETVKIGFVGFDNTADQQMEIEAYFDYLSEYYNIEVMYSENLVDAEGELNFINSCAAAGCKAVIGYYNEAMEGAAQACADLGMYYWGGFGGDEDAYNAVKDNEYYLGGYTLGNAEYEAGYSIAKTLADQGCKKIVFTSGGAAMGVPMFVDRRDGFLAGIEEANANGAEVEIVKEIEGWPGTDAFTAAQTEVMGMDFDAIASTFEIAMWFQLVMESGRADSISMGTVGSVSELYSDFVNMGLITCVVNDNTEVVFGNAIPMILNAVSGNKLVNADGSALRFPVERWTVTNADQFNAIYETHKSGNWFVTAEDIAQLIVALNPEANTDTFTTYYGSFNIDKAME